MTIREHKMGAARAMLAVEHVIIAAAVAGTDALARVAQRHARPRFDWIATDAAIPAWGWSEGCVRDGANPRRLAEGVRSFSAGYGHARAVANMRGRNAAVAVVHSIALDARFADAVHCYIIA